MLNMYVVILLTTCSVFISCSLPFVHMILVDFGRTEYDVLHLFSRYMILDEVFLSL